MRGKGTPGYLAPEGYTDFNQGGYYGRFVDIFALGVILYNLRTSATPFAHGFAQQDNNYKMLVERPDYYWA